ncbi:MAG: translation initiation factor IF-6 [archaeon]|jgi:translation initiation factor 6
MKVDTMKILGSPYVGLFAVANDNICLVPNGIRDEEIKKIEETLEVKTIKISFYESSLLSVFGCMNNKKIFLPANVAPRETEQIEKEIKVEIINTQNALGNLVAVNDFGAIISKTLTSEVAKQIKASGLNVAQTNIAEREVVGSAIAATSNAFVMNPNASKEEVKKVQETLNVKGGFATANSGDALIRNSIVANSKGFVAGSLTTGHELNRIEESLGGGK